MSIITVQCLHCGGLELSGCQGDKVSAFRNISECFKSCSYVGNLTWFIVYQDITSQSEGSIFSPSPEPSSALKLALNQPIGFYSR